MSIRQIIQQGELIMKKIISIVLAAAAALSMTFTVSAESTEKLTPSGIAYSDIGGSIDSYIKERKAGLASCAVSVFDSDGVIFDGFYGYSDIGNGAAADEETVYEWGSCSKLLVWTSVMQQYERGNIDLDADIRDYLPEGFLSKLQYPEEKITMINLMSHNAGFQESFYENQQAAPDDVYDTLEDAVRACECYQAYHVGECTAYSNWGTALAAYIVECTSGKDYVTYVHENIFAPLGMTHTCIDPLLRDNEWVAAKRSELKCYSRYDEPQYNEDYGECRYAVQLFPAGAGIGTLGDFSKFGQAFVAADCPLFENEGTRELMFTPTSYYGNSDIAKNCHGLWTNENKVQTIGHSGNTGGCSSNLVIYPETGLGVVVMTNEPSENAFNSGIPGLLFGYITDRPEFKVTAASSNDISGVFTARRTIANGAAMASQYMGQLFPWDSNGDGTYSMRMFGLDMGGEAKPILRHISDDMFVMEIGGMSQFMYGTKTDDGYKLEMMSMDIINRSYNGASFLVSWGFVLFAVCCIAALLIKLIVFAVRKLRKSDKNYTFSDKQILLQQLIYAVSGLIFYLLICETGAINSGFTAISGILAAILAVISLANCGVLCYNTIKIDLKTRTKVKQIIWAALCIAYAAFIAAMQLYCFWKM